MMTDTDNSSIPIRDSSSPPSEGSALVGSSDAGTVVRSRYGSYGAMLLLSLSFILLMIAMSTLGWIVGDSYSIGLTKAEMSSGGIVYEADLDSNDEQAGRSVLGTGILAILMACVALVSASAKSWGYHVPHYKAALVFGCFLSAVSANTNCRVFREA